MTTDSTAALRQSPFFEEFQPRHMEKLMSLGSHVRFERDEVIFREGDDPGLFFIILSGRVALESTAGRQPVRIQTLYPGEELGFSALLGRKRHFEARALEHVEAMSFEAARLRDACQGNPHFGYAFLCRMLALVDERLESTRLQLVSVLSPPNPR